MLSDTGVAVVPSEDVRGLEVRDLANERIGTVEDLAVDEQVGRVRFLKIGSGGLLGFGRRHWLVPVDVVDGVSSEHLFLRTSRERMSEAPAWEPIENDGYLREVCAYYGSQPFWTDGYQAPDWTSPE
jgi:sporulation protein YlmC with PRC-barrel domain